ncbi:glutamic acid-rich protein-like [Neltuma alba]|uniref:glutamic acid-rich protein-like n=1 Tax=Neltuma alba TaxID=207710 RepID=UPI0010A3EC6B|nr:glutamic acid-rich protein-like [Prosopis alba]
MQIYCLQHFPLGKEKAAKNENAITYWDEEKVKARVKSEKNSDRGILHGVPSVGGASTSASNTGIKLTHPEIKRTYERLMTMVEGLVSTIGEELVSLQLRLTDEIDKEDVVEAVSSEDDKEKATEDEETGEEGKGSPKDSILSQEEQQSEPEGDDKEEGKSASREEESQSQPEEKGEGSHSGSEDDGEEKTQDKSSDAAAKRIRV